MEVENIEVFRGGASSLYGDGGLSGAVSLRPRKHLDSDIGVAAFDIFGGTQKTLSGSGILGYRLFAKWFADASIGMYQTRGYKPVEKSARGPVDSYSGVRSGNLRFRLTRDLGESGSIFVSPSYFGEVRTNGTGLQTNRTHIRQLITGGDLRRETHSIHLNWRVFGGTQVYDQIFSTINTTRTTDALNRVQRVPAQTAGFSAQISVVYKDQTFLAGAEFRNVRGASDEIAVTNSLATSKIGAGGREGTAGLFFQDFARIGKKFVVAGAIRYDRWNNYRAFSLTRTLSTGAGTTTVFPGRTEDAVSPQAAVLYHFSDEWSFYASASRSFRSPTLNELYRAFRVGSVLTTANENLKAERANNFEAGIGLTLKRFSLRTNGFWTSIDRPIANVTLTTTPTLITRQRQNAGTTRSTGVEIEAETRVKQISLSAGYLFADSTVTAFPSNPILVGLLIPQVARHQLTFQARYARSKWTLAVQGRASSEQFDDDLNQFRLEPYGQVDVFASRRLKEKLEIYAAVENVFNSRYSVGKTPIRTVSSPTNFRVGFRWK